MIAGGLAAFFFHSKTLKVEEGLCAPVAPHLQHLHPHPSTHIATATSAVMSCSTIALEAQRHTRVSSE